MGVLSYPRPIQELDSNGYVVDDISAEELGFSDVIYAKKF